MGRNMLQAMTNISIHALLAESDGHQMPYPNINAISIHALLAESDAGADFEHCGAPGISIHALLAESDHLCK